MKIKNFFGVLLITSQLATAAYGINQRLLDSEVEIFTSKLCSGVPIKKDRIKENLDFLNDNDPDVDPKYSQTNNFSTYYEQITKDIQESRLLNFAKICKEVYEEGGQTEKIAVSMIFEKVSEGFTKYIQKITKQKQAVAEISKHTQPLSIEDLRKIFANADKSMKAAKP